MDAKKAFQLAMVVLFAIVALAVLGAILSVTIGLLQLAFVAAVIVGLYFLAERLFGKGR